MVNPMTAALAAVYLASGTENSFTGPEAMNEVDDTANGHQRYTVYEITDEDKRYLCISTIPTFEADTAGNGIFEVVTGTVEYPGGRLILASPRGSTDVVRLATGKHYIPSKALGGSVAKTSRKNLMEMFALLGEEWQRRHVVGKDFSISLESYVMANCAEYTSSGGNDNSHFTAWHEDGGLAGDDLSITLTDPGAPGNLGISVSGQDITATLGYAEGAITTTAQELVEALEANAFVRALGWRTKVKDGETGVGIVAALVKTSLVGGADPEDFTGKDNLCIVIVYEDEDSDRRLEGYCHIGDVNTDLAPGKLIKETLDLQGHGKLYRRM